MKQMQTRKTSTQKATNQESISPRSDQVLTKTKKKDNNKIKPNDTSDSDEEIFNAKAPTSFGKSPTKKVVMNSEDGNVKPVTINNVRVPNNQSSDWEGTERPSRKDTKIKKTNNEASQDNGQWKVPDRDMSAREAELVNNLMEASTIQRKNSKQENVNVEDLFTSNNEAVAVDINDILKDPSEFIDFEPKSDGKTSPWRESANNRTYVGRNMKSLLNDGSENVSTPTKLQKPVLSNAELLASLMSTNKGVESKNSSDTVFIKGVSNDSKLQKPVLNYAEILASLMPTNKGVELKNSSDTVFIKGVSNDSKPSITGPVPNSSSFGMNTIPNSSSFGMNTIPNSSSFGMNTIPNSSSFGMNTIPNSSSFGMNTIPNSSSFGMNTSSNPFGIKTSSNPKLSSVNVTIRPVQTSQSFGIGTSKDLKPFSIGVTPNSNLSMAFSQSPKSTNPFANNNSSLLLNRDISSPRLPAQISTAPVENPSSNDKAIPKFGEVSLVKPDNSTDQNATIIPKFSSHGGLFTKPQN